MGDTGHADVLVDGEEEVAIDGGLPLLGSLQGQLSGRDIGDDELVIVDPVLAG